MLGSGFAAALDASQGLGGDRVAPGAATIEP